MIMNIENKKSVPLLHRTIYFFAFIFLQELLFNC